MAGVANQMHKWYNKLSIDPEVRSDLTSLQDMTITEVEGCLPGFLAYDCNRHHRQTACPTAIFIDTYEALWPVVAREQDAFTRDEWVRDLAEGVTNALIITAGRERIRWPEFSSDWAKRIEHQEIDYLEPDYRIAYLKSAGISSQKLIADISSASQGHPYYLDLCIDIQAEAKSPGESEGIEWPDDRRELFERFVKTLSDTQLDLMEALAPANTFDEDYVKAVARQFDILLPLNFIRNLDRLLFFKKVGRYFKLHDLMRRSLVLNMDPKRLAEIRVFILRFLSEKLLHPSPGFPEADVIVYLNECSRQLRLLAEVTAGSDWFNDVGRAQLQKLQRRGQASSVLTIVEDLMSIGTAREWPLEVRHMRIDMIHLQGRYTEAVNVIQAELDGIDLAAALARTDTALLYVRSLHHRMMYEPVDPLWSLAEASLPTLLALPESDALEEALFLLGGNLGLLRGLYSSARPHLRSVIRIAVSSGNRNLLCRCQRKVADFVRQSGQLRVARKIAEDGLELADAGGMSRYRLYLECTLGDLSRLEGRSEDALSSFRLAREGFAQAGIEGWLGHTYLGEAAVYMDQRQYASAEACLSNADHYYTRAGQAWGNLHAFVIRELLNVMSGTSKPDEISARLGPGLTTALDLGYMRDAATIRSRMKASTGQIYSLSFL